MTEAPPPNRSAHLGRQVDRTPREEVQKDTLNHRKEAEVDASMCMICTTCHAPGSPIGKDSTRGSHAYRFHVDTDLNLDFVTTKLRIR